MRPLYAPGSFDYPAGYPLALLAATVGMFAGVILGALLVNLAPVASRQRDPPPPLSPSTKPPPPMPARRGGSLVSRSRAALAELKRTASASDHYRVGERPTAAEQTVATESRESAVARTLSSGRVGDVCRASRCCVSQVGE